MNTPIANPHLLPVVNQRALPAELLDAFLYHNYQIGDLPGTTRLGKQVVSWGESTFIQGGINAVNPVDVAAFRRPGSEVKEGLIPVNMFYVSQSLTDNLSADLRYHDTSEHDLGKIYDSRVVVSLKAAF